MTEKELVSEIITTKKLLILKEKEVEDLKKVLQHFTNIMLQHAEDKGIKSTAKYEGIGSITVQEPKRFYSISDENESEAFKFLKENELDGFIKYDINDRVLTREMNTLREAGVEIPKCINCYEKQTIKINM